MSSSQYTISDRFGHNFAIAYELEVLGTRLTPGTTIVIACHNMWNYEQFGFGHTSP